MYTFLDYFFVVFHGCLVLFSLAGWGWRRTRRIHLATMGLIILSWFGLGAYYGWGYCPFTDWHWRVKARLGETNLPYSYVKYYVDRLTGLSWDPLVVDVSVLVAGLLAFSLSCWLNLAVLLRSTRNPRKPGIRGICRGVDGGSRTHGA